MANLPQRERNTTAYDYRLLRWIWEFVHPYRRMFWASMLLMPLNTAFSLAQPYMIKLTVDLFLSPRAGHHPPAWLAPVLRAAGSPRTGRDGRALRAAVDWRLHHFLRPVLSDHDGRAV